MRTKLLIRKMVSQVLHVVVEEVDPEEADVVVQVVDVAREVYRGNKFPKTIEIPLYYSFGN